MLISITRAVRGQLHLIDNGLATAADNPSTVMRLRIKYCKILTFHMEICKTTLFFPQDWLIDWLIDWLAAAQLCASKHALIFMKVGNTAIFNLTTPTPPPAAAPSPDPTSCAVILVLDVAFNIHIFFYEGGYVLPAESQNHCCNSDFSTVNGQYALLFYLWLQSPASELFT